MNCDCLKEIEDKLVKEQPFKDIEILSALIERQYQHINFKLVARTCSTVRIVAKGRMQKINRQLQHRYCPFCGTKIDPEKGGTSGKG